MIQSDDITNYLPSLHFVTTVEGDTYRYDIFTNDLCSDAFIKLNDLYDNFKLELERRAVTNVPDLDKFIQLVDSKFLACLHDNINNGYSMCYVIHARDVKDFLDNYFSNFYDCKRILPQVIIDTCDSPFPRPAIQLSKLEHAYIIGHAQPEKMIHICRADDKFVACLNEINERLAKVNPAPFSLPLRKAAIKKNIYKFNEYYYYCELADVDDILADIGSDDANHLRNDFKVATAHLNDTLSLCFVSYFKAPNGANFDLLADEQLKNFFIKLKQLWQSSYAFRGGAPTPSFREQFNQIFQANVLAGGTNETLEVVALDDVKTFLDTEFITDVREKVFPYEIFKVVETPIPKRAEEIYGVKVIYHTGEDDLKDRIYIYNDGERNLVSVFDLSRWVFNQDIHINSQVVNAALRFDLFYNPPSDVYFIDLRDVKNFLGYVDGSEKLLKRFNFQVFMSPTPAVSTILNLNCKYFTSANFNGKIFQIYKGVGFAENAFFFKPADLADIIGLDTDYENALDETVFATGELWDGATRYCRLSFVPYLLRHCLARLWNGSNQDHPIIKTGWAFIHWFNDFLPNFYKQHVPVRCSAQYIPDANWELGDAPKLDDSLKDFFETFDKACRNFKSQLLEAQS